VKVMFLDESGIHGLSRKHLESNYPIFVLGGVIADRAYVREVIEPEMNQFKAEYFGRTDIILHTVNMNEGTGDYDFLADEGIRNDFYNDLHQLLDKWDYKVIACVIKKPELVAKYGENANDPYHYSLNLLVERFCKELGDDLDTGFICAENRGGSLDRELMQEWERLRTEGTYYASARRIDNRIVGLDLRDKKPNLAGMQLADLVITPIGRHILGKPAKPNRVQWEVVEKKLCRKGSRYLGVGLVIQP
jgi:hypothetical protein